jgi:hypothetical protein
MNLYMLSNFMKILNSTMKHPTENEYFSKPILFTTIYLLQWQKLNPRNFSKHEIIMSNFVLANCHDVHMYEKCGGLNFHGFL